MGADLLDDNIGISSSDTLNLGQGKHNLVLSIDICIEKTQNVLERILVWDY
jgi:hypothetical protein